MTEVAALSITVDASAAKRKVDDLATSFERLKRSVSSSSGGGAGFSQLGQQVASAANGFNKLQSAAGGIRSASRDATAELRSLAGGFDLVGGAVKALAAGLAGLSIVSIGRAIQDAGQRLTSFKIALDSVAESPKEVGQQLNFLNDLATKTGGALSTMTPSYQQLGTAMRALALDTSTIQKTFTGLQMAFSAMHVGARDQSLAMREFAEVFSMGDLHLRQVQALATHIPTVYADLEKATGKSAADLHKLFKAGGIPAEEIMPKLADIWQQRFGPQMSSALEHSTAQLNLFDTALERLKQKAYDSGFDAGLTSFLKSITGAQDAAAAIDDLGTRLGRAFQTGFAALTVFTKALWDSREPLIAVGGTAAAIVSLGAAFRIASAGAALLFSRVGLLASATVLLMDNWKTLTDTLSGNNSGFNVGASYLGGLAKGLLSGKGIDGAMQAGDDAARETFFAERGKANGTSYAENFENSSKSLFGRITGALAGALGVDFDRAMQEYNAIANARSAPVEGHGAYAETKKAHDEMRRIREQSMRPEAEKLFDKLNPSLKAAHELADQFTKIDSMLGKKAPDGRLINANDLTRMKEFAKYAALEHVNPAAARIRDDMEKLRVEAQFAGNKDQLAEETKVLELKHSLMAKNLELAKSEEQAYRAIIRAQQELAKGGSNGFTQWANSVKTGVDMMNESVKSSMDTLSSGVSTGITNLITNGKGQFKDFGQAVKAEIGGILGHIGKIFLDAGIKSLMAKAIQGMFPNGGFSDNIQKALGMGGKELGKATDALGKLQTTAQMDVKAAVVNIYGGVGGTGLKGIGESGLTALSPFGGGITGKDARAFRMWGGASDDQNAFKGATGSASYFAGKAFGTGSFNSKSAAALIKSAGGSDDEARTLGAIAMAESSGRPLAHNTNRETGDNSYGLWQINMLDKMGPERLKKFGLSKYEDLFDPQTNARVALQMSRQAKGFGDWSTYTSGKYQKFLSGVGMTPTGSITSDSSAPDLSNSVAKLANQFGPNGGTTVAGAADNSSALGNLGSLFGGLGGMGSFALPLLGLGATALGALLSHHKKRQHGNILMAPGGATISSVSTYAEGGFSGSGVSSVSNMPASFWAGAPHYAEGVPNTSGGIPAVLHNNEAVVPLSRGREIPVKMVGDGAQGGGSMTNVRQVINLHAKDHDSFRKNTGQVSEVMLRQLGRALARNG
jgi:tape measure domain-containing protein